MRLPLLRRRVRCASSIRCRRRAARAEFLFAWSLRECSRPLRLARSSRGEPRLELRLIQRATLESAVRRALAALALQSAIAVAATGLSEPRLQPVRRFAESHSAGSPSVFRAVLTC